MNILILTQKVDQNDDVLGFFHVWIREFAKHYEKVTVIALGVGEYDLPQNVRVLSLGKGKINIKYSIFNIFAKPRYILLFYYFIIKYSRDYDAVFVHMNPIYVVLGSPLWRMWKKKVGLWYTHRQVDLKLRIAEKFANIIFTVVKESFTLPTEKLQIVGHGIPVENFKNAASSFRKNSKLRIISVSRITPIKNLDTLIEAVGMLRNKDFDVEVLIVGGPAHKRDEKYLEKLKKLVTEEHLEDSVTFAGSVPNNRVKEYFWKSDLSINSCPTGGIDKAVLESVASGLPVLVANEAFSKYFGIYRDTLLFKERDATDLANKITALISRSDIEEIKKYVYNRTVERASLSSLITRILRIYETSQ